MTRSDGEHLSEGHGATGRPGRAAAASALAVAAAIAVAVGLVLSALNGLTVAEVFGQFLAVNAAVAVSFSTVAALILRRRPENTIGLLLCAIGALCAVATVAGPYARYALLTNRGTPGGAAAAWVNLWIWVLPMALASLVLPLVFPDGRLPSRRWWPAKLLTASTLGVLVITAATEPEPDASLPEVPNPFLVDELQPLLVILKIALPALLLVSLTTSIAAVVTRFRRSQGDERRQVEWLAFALALVAATSLVPILLRLLGADIATAPLVGTLQAIVVPLLPISVGVAVLRYRLYDIDVLVERTFLYALLTACVVVIYVVVVGYLGALFHTQGSLLISLIATGIVAVAFQPLRERMNAALNRLMYGYRDDPYVVLSRLGERVETALAHEAVLETIVQTVRDTLKLPYVAIALANGAHPTVAAESGQPPRETLAVPLSYHGEKVGNLLVGRRPGEHDFSTPDRILLTDLARQCGVAVHAVKVTVDLRRSRERLVAAREEERRRLSRDLHDGLGPRLAALTLRLETVRDQLAAHSDAAPALSDLAERSRSALGDIRRVVYGLRPPTLDDLGLLAAVREAATQYSTDGLLRVTITAPDTLRPLPAAVEVAAYLIIQEGLTNVVKHSGGGRCHLALALDAVTASLEVTIDDDGRGIPPDVREGVGLVSMRERAEELGGTFSVGAGPGGGTRVRALLPCPPATPDLGAEKAVSGEPGR